MNACFCQLPQEGERRQHWCAPDRESPGCELWAGGHDPGRDGWPDVGREEGVPEDVRCPKTCFLNAGSMS